MIKEFRDFALRGNVIDLAVAVVIGAAFTAIINSLVKDIIMPVVGVLLGGLEFSSLAVNVGSASVTYGNFIQAVINFIIIAFVLFLVVRSINRMQANVAKAKAELPAPPPVPSVEEQLLTEIRDILKVK